MKLKLTFEKPRSSAWFQPKDEVRGRLEIYGARFRQPPRIFVKFRGQSNSVLPPPTVELLQITTNITEAKISDAGIFKTTLRPKANDSIQSSNYAGSKNAELTVGLLLSKICICLWWSLILRFHDYLAIQRVQGLITREPATLLRLHRLRPNIFPSLRLHLPAMLYQLHPPAYGRRPLSITAVLGYRRVWSPCQGKVSHYRHCGTTGVATLGSEGEANGSL